MVAMVMSGRHNGLLDENPAMRGPEALETNKPGTHHKAGAGRNNRLQRRNCQHFFDNFWQPNAGTDSG
jgi:hypothetical protein